MTKMDAVRKARKAFGRYAFARYDGLRTRVPYVIGLSAHVSGDMDYEDCVLGLGSTWESAFNKATKNFQRNFNPTPQQICTRSHAGPCNKTHVL